MCMLARRNVSNGGGKEEEVGKSKGRTNGGVRRQHKGLRLHSEYEESTS